MQICVHRGCPDKNIRPDILAHAPSTGRQNIVFPSIRPITAENTLQANRIRDEPSPDSSKYARNVWIGILVLAIICFHVASSYMEFLYCRPRLADIGPHPIRITTQNPFRRKDFMTRSRKLKKGQSSHRVGLEGSARAGHTSSASAVPTYRQPAEHPEQVSLTAREAPDDSCRMTAEGKKESALRISRNERRNRAPVRRIGTCTNKKRSPTSL